MREKWHAISLTEVFAETKSTNDGLTHAEAATRLAKSGRNALPEEKPYSKTLLLLRQFNSPLMYILLATVVISLLLKHYSDTMFIALVLCINTTVGFYQENKAVIDGMLQWACDHSKVRLGSGLVKQQSIFLRLRNRGK